MKSKGNKESAAHGLCPFISKEIFVKCRGNRDSAAHGKFPFISKEIFVKCKGNRESCHLKKTIMKSTGNGLEAV